MTGFSNEERIAADRLNRLCRRYLGVSFVCLGLGLFLGAAMMAFGNDNFQFVHTHVLLVGFVLFFMYALGYRLIPPAFGAKASVVHIGLATAQFYLAVLGLLGMVVGAVMPVGLGLDRVAVLFGLVEAASGILFAIALGRALSAPKARTP